LFNLMCVQICKIRALMCALKLNAGSIIESTFRCAEFITLSPLMLFRRDSIEEVIMVGSCIMRLVRVDDVLMWN